MMIGPSAPNGPPLPITMPDASGFNIATFGDIRLLPNRIASIASGIPWPRIFSDPKRAISPTTTPPATGTAAAHGPSVFSAGERSANENCWKKNRFVNRWMRLSSANAASVLSTPIASARSAMRGSRVFDAKSRLCGAAMLMMSGGTFVVLSVQ
ncbi:chloride channel core domain protein [Burkholderia thailandensis E444]|nr:chloride channel core domain protein [Burkholderia thailandensis E444]